MWRELIRELDPAAELRDGATEADLKALEAALNVRLSQELRSLLHESDGVLGENGPWYVWPTQRIVEENRGMRQWATPYGDDSYGYMAFDSLLFFANAGVDGILFALPIPAGQTMPGKRIYAWYPIEDSRPCVASSLEDYLRRWLAGTLEV